MNANAIAAYTLLLLAAAASTLTACSERAEREKLENENAELHARITLALANLDEAKRRLDVLTALHAAAQQGGAQRCRLVQDAAGNWRIAEPEPEPDDALDDGMWDAMLGWADQC